MKNILLISASFILYSCGGSADSPAPGALFSYSFEDTPVQRFTCLNKMNGSVYGDMVLFKNNDVDIYFPRGSAKSTYQYSNGIITFGNPINEQSYNLMPKLGLIGRFETRSKYCYAVAYDTNDVLNVTANCPRFQTANGSFEEHSFVFNPNNLSGTVRWVKTFETILGGGVTTTASQVGVFRIKDNGLYMYFGNVDNLLNSSTDEVEFHTSYQANQSITFNGQLGTCNFQ